MGLKRGLAMAEKRKTKRDVRTPEFSWETSDELPHELLNISLHLSLCSPAKSTMNYRNWWSECSDLRASSRRCWCLWRPSSVSAGLLRCLPPCVWYLQHNCVTNRRPLRDNPKANRGHLKHHNGSIRKHYVWQVQGLQGALVLHLLLVWITLIIFVTDVCFTGHRETQLNGACLPVWRVWRTLINSRKKNESSLKKWNPVLLSLFYHWQESFSQMCHHCHSSFLGGKSCHQQLFTVEFNKTDNWLNMFMIILSRLE